MNARPSIDEEFVRGLHAALDVKPDPEADVEKIDDAMRAIKAHRERKIAARRKESRETLATLHAAKKAEKARHEAAVRAENARHEAEDLRLDELIAEEKVDVVASVAVHERVLAKAKAALAVEVG